MQHESNIVLKPYLRRRFLAGLIDYGIMWGMTYAYTLCFGEINDNGGLSVSGLPGLGIIALWFLFIVCTERYLGATVGNGIAGLKPLTENGLNKPTLLQSFIRHLVDPLDMFFFGLIAVLIIRNTPKKQRLGDLLAKTIVVRE